MPDYPAHKPLAHITLESGKHPQHSIIWLHGLGADGQDFAPVADELSLPVAVRFIFPHAPKRPVTVNGGFVMPAWYDIVSLDSSAMLRTGINTQQDAAGIATSQSAIEALIAQEVARGIATQNIFLAGFSQGGAIALHTALRHPRRLAGILALSTYLPLADTAPAEATAAALQTPVFMAHGRSDPIVSYQLGLASRDALQSLGMHVEWHEYAMPHTVSQQEIRDIETWLTQRLV